MIIVHGIQCACEKCSAFTRVLVEQEKIRRGRWEYFKSKLPAPMFKRNGPGSMVCAACNVPVTSNALGRSAHERSKAHRRAVLLAFMERAWPDAMHYDRKHNPKETP